MWCFCSFCFCNALPGIPSRRAAGEGSTQLKLRRISSHF
jgi:hypothetical protein